MAIVLTGFSGGRLPGSWLLFARDGVAGPTRDEVGQPVGGVLNDNLLRELMLSTVLVPPDLALIDLA